MSESSTKIRNAGEHSFYNNLIISQLSLERCLGHLAHIRATLYMCHPANLGLEDNTTRCVHKLLSQIDEEISTTLSFINGQLDVATDN